MRNPNLPFEKLVERVVELYADGYENPHQMRTALRNTGEGTNHQRLIEAFNTADAMGLLEAVDEAA